MAMLNLWQDRIVSCYYYLDPLFLSSFLVCVMIIGLLFYNYFQKFSIFWKILLTLSCGSFIYSYLKVGFSDPGIAHSTRPPTPLDREQDRFCHFCEIIRDRGTEHCQDCGICIIEMDHHCPWVGKCIGKLNLTAFYVFLACTFGNMIICFVATSVVAVMIKSPPMVAP